MINLPLCHVFCQDRTKLRVAIQAMKISKENYASVGPLRARTKMLHNEKNMLVHVIHKYLHLSMIKQ